MIDRVYVVTGVASGMGHATRELLEQAGHRVIGVDRAGADVVIDLVTPAGRLAMIEGVGEVAGGRVDAVIACAGIGGADLVEGRETREAVIRVNYFGAVATLSGLLPLLSRGSEARAATVTSIVYPAAEDDRLIAACLEGDEEHAVELCADPAYSGVHDVYIASKRALARWVRRNAPTEAWAGAGIPLNAVGPGLIDTPMTRHLLATEDLRARVAEGRPMPLRGVGLPEHVASLLVWLTSPGNGYVTGQIVFVDGGNDAVRRGDNVW